MTKIIVQEIHEGNNQFRYRLNAADSWMLLLMALKVKKADVNLSVTLVAPGASATIVGLALGREGSFIRFHTAQIHSAPTTTSNLLVKSVVPENATFLYEGSIRVEKQAQKTDAYQRNENLLTGDTAHSQSNPSLEILANDVRCTHGAATSPIPEEELWYLKSRGIGVVNAKKLYIEGYFSSAIDRIDDERQKSQVWQKIRSAI